MHPADIKASLSKAGRRQSSIARELKVTQPAIHLVIAGTSKSQRIANAISQATGILVKELWPGQYPNLEKLQTIAARGQIAELSLRTPPRSSPMPDQSSARPRGGRTKRA